MPKSEFNEQNRVQIPALIHLNKMGYHYIGKTDKTNSMDSSTNILLDSFNKAFEKLNSKAPVGTCEKILETMQKN
ncbi:hypothetical protein NHP21005_10490 [Helicobacter sp. NHP21005]|uniref:hypothetical protein n=1 Tax=Helicobacter felistomachi TaxID=3040201 RepID=UPI0025738813|nr:hypothetical protein [Helicobacter sp. NHP21005]BEG57361.1 hypothetical protein NHP21005_10490 [Helicobacter sp. NHP21005]